MSTANRLSLYRAIVREVNQASLVSRAKRNPIIAKHCRTLFEQARDEPSFERDMVNLVTLLRSQRMHKTLIERYNPLHDLTAEERVKATARRVGLDMPVQHHPGDEE